MVRIIMASIALSQRRGWLCAPELLVVLTLVTTLLVGCSGGTPVPVVVSTVYRSVPYVADIAADGAGNFLLLTSIGAVYRGLPNGATQLVATIGNDGSYLGITCDASTNVAYVTGYHAFRVYKLVLSTVSVRTFAGKGVQGYADGVGTAAQFSYPWGIVHYAPTGLLYMADRGNRAIRKIVFATASVTIVANIATGATLCRYLLHRCQRHIAVRHYI